jgi:hypothetical protein
MGPSAHGGHHVGEPSRNTVGGGDVCDSRPRHLREIHWGPIDSPDGIGGLHHAIGSPSQLHQIDFRSFPHASCWQMQGRTFRSYPQAPSRLAFELTNLTPSHM